MLEELERVRAYRADEPAVNEAITARARADLMRAIAGEEQRAPRRITLARRQRRRRMVLAAAVAGVAVVVAGMVGFHTAATPQSALAQEMDQLATVAASQDWTGIPGPGQYIYTASYGPTGVDTGDNGRECSTIVMQHREIWIATDGSGALDETESDGAFTSAADQANCAALNITDPNSQDSSGGQRFPAGGLSLPTNNWKSLSTDPATVLKQVHQLDGGPDTPGEWFTNVADFMRETDVPPAIRAALYQATALIPGVRALGVTSDPANQTGLGVAFYDNGEPTHELIFDQQTGKLLGEEYFDSTGKLGEWTAYTAQEVVDSVPDYPMTQESNAGGSNSAVHKVAPAPATSTTPAG